MTNYNPATIQSQSTTENVTTAEEITMAVIEYLPDGFKLTTLATEQIELHGQVYKGAPSRHDAIAPSLTEAATRAEAMFVGEADADDFTAEKVSAMFDMLGRYFARFHTVQTQIAASPSSLEVVAL
jgi:hypothetical protein